MSSLSFSSCIGVNQPVPSVVIPSRKVTSSAARALAFAHFVETVVENGTYGSAAEIASALGITRARISQVGMLLRLDPSTQERILFGDDNRTTRALREECAEASWQAQQKARLL